MRGLDARIADLEQRRNDESAQWQQSTSVILIVIATLLMALSLSLGASMTVLSNGILLGGLFTMLYGVGWGLSPGIR